MMMYINMMIFSSPDARSDPLSKKLELVKVTDLVLYHNTKFKLFTNFILIFSLNISDHFSSLNPHCTNIKLD